jgi:hypothetical protein
VPEPCVLVAQHLGLLNAAVVDIARARGANPPEDIRVSAEGGGDEGVRLGANVKQIHRQLSSPSSSYAQFGPRVPSALHRSGGRSKSDVGALAQWKLNLGLACVSKRKNLCCHTIAALYVFNGYLCVFAHSCLVKNRLNTILMTNHSFLRWECHTNRIYNQCIGQ